MKLLATLTFALIVLCGSTAAAQQQLDFDREVLRSIDTVPTRAYLDQTWEDARDRLEAAATDSTKTIYIRHRAISLLSLYPDERTRNFLEKLLAHPDPEVRRMAVYTLGRGFGEQADAALVQRIADVIADDEPVVAHWAVRSLRWIRHDAAARLLHELISGDDERVSRLASLTLRRRPDVSR